MIKNIIFDLGNVIINYDQQATYDEISGFSPIVINGDLNFRINRKRNTFICR